MGRNRALIDSLQIRLYYPGDLDRLVALFTATVRSVNSRDYTPEQVAAWAPIPPDLERWRTRLAALRVWVAEMDGELVGFCALGGEDYVDFLYIDHRFQRRGIAQALLRHAEAQDTGRGRRFHTQASITARPFFERMGYVVRAAQEVDVRGVKLCNFIMEKPAQPGQ